MMSLTTPTNLDRRKGLTHKLQHLEKSLLRPSAPYLVILRMFVTQSNNTKSSYPTVRRIRTACYHWTLQRVITALEKRFYDCSLQIKELLRPHAYAHEPTPGPTHSNSEGVKLPKLDVPTFDDNILNWKCFGSNSVFWSMIVPLSWIPRN